MTKETKLQFARRYRAALRLHLHRPLRGRLVSSSAGALGRDAVSLGLDSMELARLHDRAFTDLSRPRPRSVGQANGQTPLTVAGVFFLGALAPFERTRPKTQTRASDAELRADVLRERRAAALIARRQVRHEAARRRAAEARLVRVEQRHQHLLRHSRRLQAQSRQLSHRIIAAQEEERKQISRELHNEVAQILAGINLRLAALKEAGAISNRRFLQGVAQTQRLVEQSVGVVNRYACELRPAMLDDLGLIPALRSLVRGLPGRRGLCVRITAFAGVEALDSTRRTVIFRVVQEAIANVVRHAHARVVTVCIEGIPDGVRLVVHDDGKSFPLDHVLASRSGKRLGLHGMRERVEMVGGSFSIESAAGLGTTVRAEIPFGRGHGGETS